MQRSNYFLLLLAGLCSGLAACEPAVPTPTTVTETVDQVVMPHIALGANVGIIVGVSQNGVQTICSYGEAELGTRTPITAQSVLEIASLTKTFTALALADMHLKGEVNLDDSVNKYLPAGVRAPSWHGKPITLRQLANHTSGLPSLPTNINEEQFNQYTGYSLDNLYDFLNHHQLEREPGTESVYSNVGFGLLGHALSLRNRSDYAGLIRTRIAQPLGLTQVAVGRPADPLVHRVPGHDGHQQVASWAEQMQPSVQGTGALLASLADLLRYLDANMGVTPTSLQAAMTLTHQLTHSTSGSEVVEGLGYENTGMGLGWSVGTLDGHPLVWKNGLNGGFASFMGFDKTTKTGVVLLCNSTMKPDLFQTQMGLALLKRLLKRR